MSSPHPLTSLRQHPCGKRFLLAWAVVSLLTDATIAIVLTDIPTQFFTSVGLPKVGKTITDCSLLEIGCALLIQLGFHAWMIFPDFLGRFLWVFLTYGFAATSHTLCFTSYGHGGELFFFLFIATCQTLILISVRRRIWINALVAASALLIYLSWREIVIPPLEHIVHWISTRWSNGLAIHSTVFFHIGAWTLHNILVGAAFA